MALVSSRRGFLGAAALGAAGLAAPAARAAAPGAKGAGLAKRVVLLSLDGIRTDGLQQAKTPNLDALFAKGAFSNSTRDVMPSVTLPNWTSLLTGCGPEQHGVTDNGWNRAKPRLASVARDGEGYVTSVFTELKRQIPGMKTAFYWNWKPLIGPYNPKSFDEASFEENDGYKGNCAKALAFLKANRDNPTVVFLYDVHTDHAGHAHKWMSPQYIKAIEESDAAFGEVIDGLKAAGLFESTHFVFLTDHGGVGHGHGGVSPEEMVVPWGVVGPGIRQGHDLTLNDTVNTSPLLLRLFGAKETPAHWTGKVPEAVFA